MTTIEWTRSPDGTKGKSWNPISGCTPTSPGCLNCYAARMAKRLAGRHGYPAAPHEFDVTLHPDKLDQPLRWKKPRMIFVCSMSDFFHHAIPLDFQNKVFSIIRRCPQHTFQILTKRADQMAMMEHACGLPVLPNLWLGVSVEDADHLWRVEKLLQTPAAVRFVSLEPLLGPIDMTDYLHGMPEQYGYDRWQQTHPPLDWVIVGGESGPGARPMYPEWARSIRDQCKEAGTPFFMKQLGSVWAKRYMLKWGRAYATPSTHGDTKGAKMEYWPKDLRVREMPEVAR